MKITSLYFSFMFCTILVFSPSATGENDLSNEHGDLVLNEPDVDMLNDSTAAATTTTSTQPVADTNNLRAYGTEFSGLTRKQRGSSHNRRLPGKGKGEAAIKLPGLSMMSSLTCLTTCTNGQVCLLVGGVPQCIDCPTCVIGVTCVAPANVPDDPCENRCLNGGTCTAILETCITDNCCVSDKWKCDCDYPFGGDFCECNVCAIEPNDPCAGGGGKGKSKGGGLKTQCAIDAGGKQSCVCPECGTGPDCMGDPTPNPCDADADPCALVQGTVCVPGVLKINGDEGDEGVCYTGKSTCEVD